ncbi:MAG: anti-sigma factor [Nocardioides sp.]
MSDIHALVGAYAVDALDDVERAAFERHLAECPDCQAEVAGLREAAAMIGAAVAAEPPAGLRDRVLADIATVRPLPPPLDRPTVLSITGGRTRFRPRALVAAAAAVIALGAGAAVVQPWDDDTSQRDLTASEQVLAAADAQTFTDEVDGGGKATIVRSSSRNQAVLVASALPDAPEGSVYELWLIHDGDMVSAGLMSGGDHELWLEGDPATATGFGITVEPEGGSDTGEPTKQPITTIQFQTA